MLHIQNLSKSYPSPQGRRYVFRDFNLHLPQPCNVGLIGANGAGKSTLMRLLGGLESADRGRITTSGSVSWPIGLSGGLQGSLTCRDNVRFVCRIHATEAAAMRDKIAFIESFAAIGDAFDLPAKALSSGMRSRLMFAVAMAFEFDLYLMDEITAVGDAVFKAKCRALLEERLSRAHVIYTSHNMDEIARLCNVVVLMRPGRSPEIFPDVREGIQAYQKPARHPAPAQRAAAEAAC